MTRRHYESLSLTALNIDRERCVLSDSRDCTLSVNNEEIDIEPFKEETFPDISF